jgi:hypothetical protein
MNDPGKDRTNEVVIDMNHPPSVERWCRVLKVDEPVLRDAVKAVGSNVVAVLGYLDGNKHPV